MFDYIVKQLTRTFLNSTSMAIIQATLSHELIILVLLVYASFIDKYSWPFPVFTKNSKQASDMYYRYL